MTIAWSDKTVIRMLKLRCRGWSIRRIAEEGGVVASVDAVRAWFLREGLPTGREASLSDDPRVVQVRLARERRRRLREAAEKRGETWKPKLSMTPDAVRQREARARRRVQSVPEAVAPVRSPTGTLPPLASDTVPDAPKLEHPQARLMRQRHEETRRLRAEAESRGEVWEIPRSETPEAVRQRNRRERLRRARARGRTDSDD